MMSCSPWSARCKAEIIQECQSEYGMRMPLTCMPFVPQAPLQNLPVVHNTYHLCMWCRLFRMVPSVPCRACSSQLGAWNTPLTQPCVAASACHRVVSWCHAPNLDRCRHAGCLSLSAHANCLPEECSFSKQTCLSPFPSADCKEGFKRFVVLEARSPHR